MKLNYIITALLPLAGFIASCKKDNSRSLPAGSVYIKQADTLTDSISAEKDTLITLRFEAAIKGGSAGGHTVTFAVDTTKIAAYRTKYGNAQLLPADAYYFDKPSCKIAAGSTESEPAQFNIYKEQLLNTSSTYVLPIVIRSVDQTLLSPGQGQVLYLVFNTRKSPYGTPIADRSGWSVTSDAYLLSGDYSQLTDNDFSTICFLADLTGANVFHINVDMGQRYNIRAFTYRNGPDPLASGGYPTQVQVELSTDGINWTSKGIYDTSHDTGTGSVSVPLTFTPQSARYIRLTMSSAPVSGFSVPLVELAEIGANQ